MSETMLSSDAIRLGLHANDRSQAIKLAGQLLVEIGAVDAAYVDAMEEREGILSSYVGESFALPHGTDASRKHIRRSALAFLQFPQGVDWEEESVRACIAIAVRSDEHVKVMARLAEVLLDGEKAELLRSTDRPEDVLELLEPQRSGSAR
jgi:mannitol/fructose-specific phosphotransferase system IIA component